VKSKNISEQTEKELLLSYYDVLENIYTKSYSDLELDKLLLVFINYFKDDTNNSELKNKTLNKQIQNLKNTINIRHKKLLKEHISKKKSLNEKVDNIYKTYIQISSKYFTEKEMDTILLSVIKSVKDLEKYNIDIEQITQDKEVEYKKWLEYILSLKVGKPYTINKIDDEKVQERLYKHFKDIPTPKTIKTKNADFEINEMFEQNLLLTLINSSLAEQSDINRIRALKNSGATLTESIKTVIPNKQKHNEIKKLVEIQRSKYNEYIESQKRLI